METEDTSLFRIRNYHIHPTNKKYWVFFFSDPNMAGFFENLLQENAIGFEKDNKEDLVQRVLYGIHKKDFDHALLLNNATIGKFRKPFIEDPILRYVIIALSILFVALGIFGYINRP